MNNYPKFTWDKDMYPDRLPETPKEFKEYIKRQSFIPWPDFYAPPMSFEKWKDMMDKRRGVIVIDELAQIKPKPKVSINPTRESSWVREFEKWLNEKHNND